MIRGRTLVVLVALTVAAVGGIIVTGHDQAGRPAPGASGPAPGDRVVPGLTDKANDIARVAVTTAAGKIEIRKDGEQWILPDKAGYPADIGKVRQLVLGIADMKRVEPKTRNPELFDQLGVADPKPGAQDSRLLELADASGNPQARLIVGKEKPTAGSTRRSEYYVRVIGEDQAWLAEGNVPIPSGGNDWLNTQLINIDQKRLASLTVRFADGETARIEKTSQDAQDFAVVEPTREEKLRSTFTVNNMAQSMAQLVLQDVLDREKSPLPDPLEFSASLSTFDGLTVSLDVAKSGEEYIARVKAQAAAAIIDTNTPESQPAATAVDPTAEAKAINDRGAKWHFKLSAFAVESIGKRASDLFEIESNAEAATEAAPPSE